eukprot:TRINITY_DN15234_c0_g1::TRINITY_DN15234_c0_g1_i1::g.30824::m.30824 TRINITY_DN15234_c0_g1::TRINITY_DN15234_c0_g1_i1::g.30824  ORF type:complete len:454 (-),score=81.24,sp/Q4U2R1/HERC2_MOUSE/35.48/3e-29,sp/Q4U2R1/HERC2_MOUSE/29.59/2e-24,sp/Q4U2R1/HERC2_MOUSE/31.52/7e-23,sp/Q4U2R1/HERC2_MOUSE/29.27/1e-21,sp/Q4U2R1/HERC2_MOUSE/33.20/3e-20,sp/Q4U2R1/HERC2_MOUSE/28.84/3e-17,sp/Q4U2R1/HERC2_MOUSE/27.74/3e-13,sp/Q4U2R1/HERC2_MOUSE/23.86/1e-12,sp/Q4U2R1/HERC2_MOUSE/25.42/7e-09,sp/Q4U2R1/HERC2_MOUSE/26.00/
MTADATKEQQDSQVGVVYTWGKASGGALGHANFDKEEICPFPCRVPGVRHVTMVACGEYSTACVTLDGSLYTWGAGRGGRLGHGDELDRGQPDRVKTFQGMKVIYISLGQSHSGCVAEPGGYVYTWGKGAHGCLGPNKEDGSGGDGMRLLPDRVFWKPPCSVGGADLVPITGARQVECSHQYSGVLAGDGLYTWGDNALGKLGLGRPKAKAVALPTRVQIPEGIFTFSLGSLFAAAVTVSGNVYTWGYGGHGNLGLGSRENVDPPRRIDSSHFGGVPVSHVSCTTGQINPALDPANPATCEGKEGPHAVAVTSQGAVYTWGTCHKGILGNMRDKVLITKGDELVPYHVGDAYRDHPEDGPSGYLPNEHAVMAVASSIHSAVLARSGKVFCMGCGSDGRMGIRKYEEGLAGKRSRMKCYVSKPTAIEKLEDIGAKVTWISSSRRHMAAVVVERT